MTPPRFKPIGDLTDAEVREYQRTGTVPTLTDDETAAALADAGYLPDADDDQRRAVLDDRVARRDAEREREHELEELEALTPAQHAERLGHVKGDE